MKLLTHPTRKLNPKNRAKAKANWEKQKERQRSQLVDTGLPTVWADFAPLCNIQTSGTVKPFHPYEFQIELIKTIEQNSNTVICKSRQMGISETICSYLLMRSLTEPGFAAVIFSKTQSDASELASRIRNMAISLGDKCPIFVSESKTRVEFKGLGKLYFLPVTARSARGIPSVSVVLFDEAAFIDGVDGVYQAAVPTLSMLGDRGKVIFNSTPNGKSGLFWRLLTAGSNEVKRVQEECAIIREPGQNNIASFLREAAPQHHRIWKHRKWAKVLLHWRCHPLYGADPDWARKTREDRELSEASWRQEYELSFVDGGSMLFDTERLEAIATLDSRDAIYKGRDIEVTIWQQPDSNGRYLIGIDPNFGGSNGDYFVCLAWKLNGNYQGQHHLVAQYRANNRTTLYSQAKCQELIDLYQPEICAVEDNSGGRIIFENLISNRPNTQFESIRTGATSKVVNTDRLAIAVEHQQVLLPSDWEGIEEAKKFSQGDRRATTGHDDCIMSWAAAFACLPLLGEDPAKAYDAWLS